MKNMANRTSDIFRNNLKIYRSKLGYTQEQLSEKCNISTDYLSQIERGKRTPSFKRMDLIAKALDIEVYKLFLSNDYSDQALPDKTNI